MKVAIIKYNAGNIQSVAFALQRIGIEPIITDSPEEILSADKIIFPGVGEAAGTMKHLTEKGFDKLIVNLQQPVLGICLGMQLMCNRSEEGDVQCLGIFDQEIIRFQNDNTSFKIPHMGWNSISKLKGSLFAGIDPGKYVYFVHSYFAAKSDYTSAVCDYIQPYSAALQSDNFFAVQFHPEKSGPVGEQILRNFVEL